MRTTLLQRLSLTLFLIFCFTPDCPLKAQSGERDYPTTQCRETDPPDQTTNYISVGRPKVFDNRTLTIMLESLSEGLRNVQTQFINKEALAAAFNFLQGTRTSEVARSFSLTALPIPSLKQENTTNTGNVADNGTPLPDTTVAKTTSERAAFTPQAPGLDTLGGFPAGFNPSFGTNPSDLLSDQVNLTYQIFNLRMILERSLSDRLLGDANRPRRQAVLGFNVAVTPQRTENDAVAVVEITLTLSPNEKRCTTADDCLSLVSLMPQEKTYNAAALSTKSNAFGGAAVVNMFQVGFSERRRGQIFYLYRDSDTISYERMDQENPRKIVFGWMFRPVLGRRSVSPGLRQLFAIVSLPSADKLEAQSDAEPEEAKKGDSTMLNASVRTFWMKYDSETMTSFEEGNTNRASRFRNALSFGLTKPELFADRYTNLKDYCNVEVKPTEDYQNGLQPELNELAWRLIGPKSVVITARGNNFFPGTQVSIGDKTYSSPAEGLVLKSNQAFDLSVGLDALVNGTGSISGRYGSAIPLIATNAPPWGITITGAKFFPSFAGNRLMRIYLGSQEVEYRPNPNDPQNPVPIRKALQYPSEERYGKPVITVNGNVVLPPYDFDPVSGVIQAYVPDSFLSKGGGMVRVSYPFLPAQWTASYLVSDPALDFQITRLNSKSILLFTKDESGFTRDPTNPPTFTPQSTHFCWKLIAGNGEPLPLRTTYCSDAPSGDQSAGAPEQETATGRRGPRRRGAQKPSDTTTPPPGPVTVEVSTNALTVTLASDIPDKIILVSPLGAVFPLEVPKSAPPPAPAPKSIEMNQNDNLWVEVAVNDASKVEAVRVNQTVLEIIKSQPDADGNPPKTIQVFITRDVTAKSGDVDLTFFDKDGKILLDKDGKPITARIHISATNDKGDK